MVGIPRGSAFGALRHKKGTLTEFRTRLLKSLIINKAFEL